MTKDMVNDTVAAAAVVVEVLDVVADLRPGVVAPVPAML